MTDRESLYWRKSPMTELLRLAWPICISMLSYSAMTVADTGFVGTIGPAALAGVGLAGTLAFALVVFGMGLLRGVKVVVSQAVGAGKQDRVDEVASAGLILALIMGAFVVVFGQLVVLAVPYLAASPEAGVYGSEYLFIRILAAPLLFVFCTTKAVSYGLGDSRSPMVASIFANLLNIALDYLFIMRWGLGPSGAAWATLIATFVEAAFIVWLRSAPGFRSMRSGLAWIRGVLRVGLSTGLQFAVEVGAFTVLTILIAAMSEDEMAGHQVALCILHFAFLPIVAISEAASVMAGQAVGADRDELVPTISLLALALAVGYAMVCTLVLAVGSPQLAGLFSDDIGVYRTATNLLYVGAVFQIGDAFNIVARGMLRGTGDVRVPAIIGVSISWAALPPLTWLLGHHYGMGAVGGWFALTIEIVTAAIILWWRLWNGGWRPSAARSRAALAAI